MLFFHKGGGDIIAYPACTAEIYRLQKLGFNVITPPIELQASYPDDVKLNAASVGNFIICNSKHTYQPILGGYRLIDISQGCAKCSTLVVDDNSIITSDQGIHKKAIENGLCSLLIECGDIRLDGYQYGFIGGCGFKLSEHQIYFTGNLYSHRNAPQMEQFLTERGIEIICGKSHELIDVGSILPILQE